MKTKVRFIVIGACFRRKNVVVQHDVFILLTGELNSTTQRIVAFPLQQWSCERVKMLCR
jgi:hypothetical protein